MPAILRIMDGFRPLRDVDTPNPTKEYLDRLVKLVPAEVIGLYLGGKSLIQSAYGEQSDIGLWSEQSLFWLGWAVFCLAAVVWLRGWATSDKSGGVAPEWGAVAIAALSFIFWVLSTGDPVAFLVEDADIKPWHRLLPGLLVLAWTFVVPLIYRPKPDEPAPVPAPPAPPPPDGTRSIDTAEATRTAGISEAAFPEQYARDAVLDVAAELSSRPPIDALVSSRFASASQIRQLMGGIQDRISQRHGIWVTLADGSAADMEKLGKLSFNALWKDVWRKVLATGQA